MVKEPRRRSEMIELRHMRRQRFEMGLHLRDDAGLCIAARLELVWSGQAIGLIDQRRIELSTEQIFDIDNRLRHVFVQREELSIPQRFLSVFKPLFGILPANVYHGPNPQPVASEKRRKAR